VDVGGIQALLEDAEIYSNQSGGGAVAIRDGITLPLMRVNIVHNTIRFADGQMHGGGGVYVEKGAAMISNSRIDNNSSSFSFPGDALAVAAGQQATLKNCVISNNTGAAAQVSSAGALDFEDCQIGPSPLVGIIAVGGTLTMSRSTVYGNGTQGWSGGGLLLEGGVTATITNSTISGNHSADGGGLNLRTGGGGASADLTNVTIFGNSAQTGGNVSLYPAPDVSMTIANCIIANPPSGGNCAGKGMTSSRYSISSDNLCVLAGPGDRNGTNPMLGPLQDNGGPTRTHLPLAGSPAIDGVPGTQAPPEDQRGKTRPAGGGYDIGAVEVGGTGGLNLAAPPPGNYDGNDRGDDDGDGFPDVSEMIAGTDPNSASSLLRLIRSPRNPFEFLFQSQPGVFYRLYKSRDDLQNHLTQWVDAGMGTITGDGNPKTITIASAPGVRRRFYVLKARILDVGWP
jgi:Right handed beta helix region/Bacterial TSP3 repeat